MFSMWYSQHMITREQEPILILDASDHLVAAVRAVEIDEQEICCVVRRLRRGE